MTQWYASNLVLIQGGLIAFLLALSFQIPMRMGVFSFAGVGFYAIGAYSSGIAIKSHGFAVPTAILLGVCIAVVVSIALGLLVSRLSGLYLGMATISFDLIVSVVASNWGSLTGGPAGLFGVDATIGTAEIFVVVLACVLLSALAERGSLSRQIDCVREDRELALSFGIRVDSLKLSAFVASAIVGSLAGAFNTLVSTTVSPSQVGFGLVVLALTMVIVGGSRSWLGALIGAAIFTWLPSVSRMAGDYSLIVYGIIVAVAAIYVPNGIFGWLVSLRRVAQRRMRRLSSRQQAKPSFPPDKGDRQTMSKASHE